MCFESFSLIPGLTAYRTDVHYLGISILVFTCFLSVDPNGMRTVELTREKTLLSWLRFIFFISCLDILLSGRNTVLMVVILFYSYTQRKTRVPEKKKSPHETLIPSKA